MVTVSEGTGLNKPSSLLVWAFCVYMSEAFFFLPVSGLNLMVAHWCEAKREFYAFPLKLFHRHL